MVHLIHYTLEVHWFRIVAAAVAIHSSPIPVGWCFGVLLLLAIGRWKMCKPEHTHSTRARTLSHSITVNALKQTVNELSVRYVLPHYFPYAFLFSPLSILMNFILDCNWVRCLVSSVSELLCAYSLSFVCLLSLVSHSRSCTKFRFYTTNLSF